MTLPRHLNQRGVEPRHWKTMHACMHACLKTQFGFWQRTRSVGFWRSHGAEKKGNESGKTEELICYFREIDKKKKKIFLTASLIESWRSLRAATTQEQKKNKKKLKLKEKKESGDFGKPQWQNSMWNANCKKHRSTTNHNISYHHHLHTWATTTTISTLTSLFGGPLKKRRDNWKF